MSEPTIHVFPMAKRDDKHDQYVVSNVVDDTIVADSQAVERSRSGKTLRAGGARVLSKRIDLCAQAPLEVDRQRLKLSVRRPRELDAVIHRRQTRLQAQSRLDLLPRDRAFPFDLSKHRARRFEV